ncbi:unnamed protein product, partial [marine sediment metagenome]
DFFFDENIPQDKASCLSLLIDGSSGSDQK